MDKREYLSRLEMQLSDLTNEERREALEYYEEYFADAGEENEADVMESLGAPEQVAEQIKAGLHKEEKGMFTENGYREKVESDNPPEVYWKKVEKQRGKGFRAWGRKQSGSAGYRNTSADKGNGGAYTSGYGADGSGAYTDGYDTDRSAAGGYYANDGHTNGQNSGGYHNAGNNGNGYGTNGNASGGYYNNDYDANRQNDSNYYNAGNNGSSYNYGSARTGKKAGMSGGMIALIVVLCIFASPVILSLAAAAFSVLLGIFAAVLGVIVALIAVVIALFAAGIGLFVGGFPLLFYSPFAGMICIAVGCFLIALFLLCAMLLGMMFSKFFPWLIREVESFGKYLGRKWSERKRRGEAV